MRFFSLLFAAFLIAGCSADNPNETATGDGGQSSAELGARLIDGVQVVEIEAGVAGFSPESVRLRAGVPARLVFNRTTDADCLHHVSVPEFGVEKMPLPMHEDAAVEFTPDEDGEFTFVCGMGMQSGTLVVST